MCPQVLAREDVILGSAAALAESIANRGSAHGR